jgi:hypothetical protein
MRMQWRGLVYGRYRSDGNITAQEVYDAWLKETRLIHSLIPGRP